MPLCPECARRVPTAVATCRCGHVFDTASDAPAPVEMTPVAIDTPQRKSPPMFVVAAVLGAVLLAMLFWMNRDEAAPTQQAAAPAPSRIPAPAAAIVERADVRASAPISPEP